MKPVNYSLELAYSIAKNNEEDEFKVCDIVALSMLFSPKKYFCKEENFSKITHAELEDIRYEVEQSVLKAIKFIKSRKSNDLVDYINKSLENDDQ